MKKKKETIPSTLDARIWAKEWIKIIKKNPTIPMDEECMIGWFANAIMAGYDAAMLRSQKYGIN